MYSHVNPYATWLTPNSAHPAAVPLPSVHGALPFPPDPAASNSLKFYFTALNPTILNCTVVGRNTFPYFGITTDSSMPGYTSFRNTDGKIIALIEWKESPLVEVRNVFSKQPVNTWLSLSSDASYRIMTVNGHKYIWAPQKRTICLYPAGTPTPELLARIHRIDDGTVSLELTSTAIKAGLVEMSVVATVLLQCGHRID
ncbi:hypothetical protein C8J57DRAFT_1635830 [Mycena rebaudengoi]|nr:hypothetical protein C8J57DRAFT_1635830 [Mycena rebaudengoi]